MNKNRPTHGDPLSDAEKTFKRGADAGQKNWQGGPRYEFTRRGGLYATRTGNTHGGPKKKGKGRASGSGGAKTRDTERPVKRPGWARKYDA